MSKTTIFRQLVYNVIVPALLALVLLGFINYQHTKTILVEANQSKNAILADQIKSIQEFQDLSLDMLESTFDERMGNYSNLLVSMYFNSTRNIEKVNLNAIRDELGMDPSIEDIYVINSEGIIVNTTFAKDKGLNLFSFGEAHKKYLQSVIAGGKFVNERFTIEATTKRLKKYTYQPTLDGKYIIELGMYSTKADEIISFIRNRLAALSEDQGSKVDLFVITDHPFSLNDQSKLSDTDRPILDSICKTKQQLTFHGTGVNENFDYDYIFVDRKNSKLYKGSVIKITSDKTREKRVLRNELIKFFSIFGLTITVVVLLIYRKTKVITDPIKKLVENVNRITSGHLNERADVVGNNEVTTLSIRFNHMIEELESYYNELEQKVRDRTAEIMQQKEEIEAQRDAIEEQRNMLSITNSNLEVAYEEISLQKKHITDSIIYAKRIQTAILPPDEYWQQRIPQAFILYRPKDIVSGDFYWVLEKDGLLMIAAVDCTGHGVPGAFMSIVGYNNLSYAVNVKKARSAGDILNELNAAVTNTLRQDRGNVTLRDGMDIALCVFDFNNNVMEYAGANNPLYMIRNGELITYEPTKAPIGAFVGDKMTSFANNRVEIQKGDSFYIFSDGFADQFGGPDNKKFLKRRFKELLTATVDNPMDVQKQLIETAFDEYKGDYEQIDDILVIGVRC